MKHIDVAYLWIQDELTSKRLRVRRVKSEEPLSDATVVMGSETARGHIPIVAGHELKDASESLHKGQKGWTEETM